MLLLNKMKSKIIILILLLCIVAIVLSACNKDINIDLSGYTTVTYDCMGGHIDKLSTRTLYVKPNSLIVEPKGTQGLVQPKKSGYSLEGWYTSFTADNYTPNNNGEYVYYFKYILDESETADFVEYQYYYSDDEGVYVGENIVTDNIVYSLFDEQNESHKSLPRYNMIKRYTLYNPAIAEHKNLQRFSRSAEYIYFDENNPDINGLQRYNVTLTFDEKDRWNFITNRVGNSPLTIYANWIKNKKIIWNFNNNTDSSMVFENGLHGVTINRDELIPKTSIIPKKENYTFTYWYKDANFTQIWDFENDKFPADESIDELELYAGYIKGEYIRITNALDFSKIKNNTASKYLLCSDIVVTESIDTFENYFTGELNGNGHTINYNINAINFSNRPIDTIKYVGLFAEIKNAVIKNLNISGVINIDEKSNKTLVIGGIAGIDKGGSLFENCNIIVKMISTNKCNSDIYAGAYVGEKNITEVKKSSYNNDYGVDISTSKSKTLID